MFGGNYVINWQLNSTWQWRRKAREPYLSRKCRWRHKVRNVFLGPGESDENIKIIIESFERPYLNSEMQ